MILDFMTLILKKYFQIAINFLFIFTNNFLDPISCIQDSRFSVSNLYFVYFFSFFLFLKTRDYIKTTRIETNQIRPHPNRIKKFYHFKSRTRSEKSLSNAELSKKRAASSSSKVHASAKFNFFSSAAVHSNSSTGTPA